jgi:hypothetical protein
MPGLKRPAGALSNLALKGLEVCQGEYFDALEFLEEAWKDDETHRELYRAILQVAVAYLQIERGNYNGAVKMFLRLRQWIDPLPDRCQGVDVAGLRADAYAVQQRLVSQGRERIDGFDRACSNRFGMFSLTCNSYPGVPTRRISKL